MAYIRIVTKRCPIVTTVGRPALGAGVAGQVAVQGIGKLLAVGLTERRGATGIDAAATQLLHESAHS